MREYLVGLMYHDVESFALWKRGVTEDYESTTGLFIEADSETDALKWGGIVADELLRHVTREPSLTCDRFGYECWIEQDPQKSHWRHCLDFFQHVRCGQMPVLDRMTSDAYVKWQNKNT